MSRHSQMPKSSKHYKQNLYRLRSIKRINGVKKTQREIFIEELRRIVLVVTDRMVERPKGSISRRLTESTWDTPTIEVPSGSRSFIAESLAKFKPTNVDSIKPEKIDRRYHPVLPKGGLVVRVQARVLDGYEPTDNKWQKIFQSSLSRDNLWLTNKEHESIVNGVIPAKVQRRIARFHLVDNTRGEPPMWRDDEIKSINMKLENGKLTGNASLSTRDGSRTFDCDFYGYVKTSDGMITRFDVIALGKFFGEGTYTKNAPKGKVSARYIIYFG